MEQHEYRVSVEWLGNRGSGTSGYREYGRQLVVTAPGKHDLQASADRTFHGDRDRWNPEELLVAALAQCHMLSYLHMAVRLGVVVTAYTDEPLGVLRQRGIGGSFAWVQLNPVVTVQSVDMVEPARAAHTEAYENCFIAQSVNFPVRHAPTILVAAENFGAANVE